MEKAGAGERTEASEAGECYVFRKVSDISPGHLAFRWNVFLQVVQSRYPEATGVPAHRSSQVTSYVTGAQTSLRKGSSCSVHFADPPGPSPLRALQW